MGIDNMVYDDIIFEESTPVKVNWGVSLKMNITKEFTDPSQSEGQNFRKSRKIGKRGVTKHYIVISA
ncbi:unnamed protein product [Rhizophagus irregularis]|uniref:Uncharacterized protein n=1 Tax=Rhizophagus irregularis TaxID=588596 RepID=A0A916E7U4_9GLOM|nr:unnamed protein product [Rhizophagus irregularis]